jgi:PPOX class probable F420-dependent enzyme
VTRNEAIRRAAEARVGRMATVRPDGTPHVVPFVFALREWEDGSLKLYWIVDDKPKRSRRLQRLRNLETNPTAEVVIDGYDDQDWSGLWWVRLSGTGRIVASEPERVGALDALASKYAQYRSTRSSAVIAIDVQRVASWPGDASGKHPRRA